MFVRLAFIAIAVVAFSGAAHSALLYPLPSDQGACCQNSACFETTAVYCVNLDSFTVDASCTESRVCGSCCDPATLNYACGSIFNDSWCPADEFRTNFFCPEYYVDASIDIAAIALANASAWGFDDETTSSGAAVAYIGDVNGDGYGDFAVQGASLSDDYTGAVALVFMDGEGGVIDTKILTANEVFGFGFLDTYSYWGLGIIGLGDVNGDGIPDIAVGSSMATGVGSGGDINGFFSILFLNGTGNVTHAFPFFPDQFGVPTPFSEENGSLGNYMCPLGDWFGDGTMYFGLGNPFLDNGTLYIMAAFENGTITEIHQINRGGLPGENAVYSLVPPLFGWSCATPGDINGDGIPDLVVGAPFDTDPLDPDGVSGVAWVLLMENPIVVKAAIPIGSRWIQGLDFAASFGSSVAAAGDLDQNGVPDIWVGATDENLDGPPNNATGAVYAIFLNLDGYPIGYEVFGNGSFPEFPLPIDGQFASAIAPVGDWYGTGTSVLLVGTEGIGVYILEPSRVSRHCKNPLPPDHVFPVGAIVSIVVFGVVVIGGVVAAIMYYRFG